MVYLRGTRECNETGAPSLEPAELQERPIRLNLISHLNKSQIVKSFISVFSPEVAMTKAYYKSYASLLLSAPKYCSILASTKLTQTRLAASAWCFTLCTTWWNGSWKSATT